MSSVKAVTAALAIAAMSTSCTTGRSVTAPTTATSPATSSSGQTSSTATPRSTTTTSTSTPSSCLPLPPPQTVTADVDGDSRPDHLTFTAFDASPGQSCIAGSFPAWRVDVVLASGARLQSTVGPDLLLGNDGQVVLGVIALGPGHQQQLLLRGLGNDSQPVAIFTLWQGELVLAKPVGGGIGSVIDFAFSAAGHNCCPFVTADLTCPVVAGLPAVEQTTSSVHPAATGPNGPIDPQQVYQLSQTNPAKLRRYWQRTIYRLEGPKLLPIVNDSGTIAFGAPAPPGVPLSNNLSCQGVTQTGRT